MFEFKVAFFDSRIPTREDDGHDKEYDVYLFWPSRNGFELSLRDEFVHSRISYSISLGGLEGQPPLANRESPISSSSPGYYADMLKRKEEMKAFGYSKSFSLGLFSAMNHKLDRLVGRVRGKTQRKRPASVY